MEVKATKEEVLQILKTYWQKHTKIKNRNRLEPALIKEQIDSCAKVIEYHKQSNYWTADRLRQFLDRMILDMYGEVIVFNGPTLTKCMNKYFDESREEKRYDHNQYNAAKKEYQPTESDRLGGVFTTWLIRKAFSAEPWQKEKDADKWLYLMENKDVQVGNESLLQWMKRMLRETTHHQQLDDTVKDKLKQILA